MNKETKERENKMEKNLEVVNVFNTVSEVGQMTRIILNDLYTGKVY